MNLLPKWLLTPGIPAFNDYESSTMQEQTYKVYQAMNKLIEEYNKFVDDTNKVLTDFQAKYDEDIEVFTTSMRQEFQDFIDVVELKLLTVKEEVIADLDLTELEQQLESMTAQLTALETKVNNDIATQLSALQEQVNNDIAVQVAGAKTYTDQQIEALRNEIISDLEGEY